MHDAYCFRFILTCRARFFTVHLATGRVEHFIVGYDRILFSLVQLF